MNLLERIPKDFYKLFGSKYMDYYMVFLVAIYEESSRSYSALGLTEQECRAIINEQLAVVTIDWSEERFDEEGRLLTRSNMAAVCLRHFEEWGWLRQDFDETLNSYVVSFPEYSQLYVELFQKLSTEEDSEERESVLAVYSYLFTYSSDPEKNMEMLKSALRTSGKLSQMLAAMQEGMRGYFDELSGQRDFRGIQEVLIREIHNSDSKKYAILTTTDSFYRYKEAVKELIDQNLSNPDTDDGTAEILLRIEREFDAIERRYNRLIEQKTVFASRAAARIRYILREGSAEEDQTLQLVNLLNRSSRKEEILEDLAASMSVTSPYRVITEKSFYVLRDVEREAFQPVSVSVGEPHSGDMEDFILQPLYTREEIRSFRKEHEKGGVFSITKDAVQSVEDLEKLFFLWQEATERQDDFQRIAIGEEIRGEGGLTFSGLTIENAEEETNEA